MFGRLKFLFFYLLMWLAFFASARLLFLSYHSDKPKNCPLAMLPKLFYMVCGWMFRWQLTFLYRFALVLAGVFLPFFRKALLYQVYTVLILLPVLLIIAADLELYSQWGFRMDATPLKYLNSPAEVWASISHLPVR